MKGKILGSRYKILEYLAEGGFGRTYLAEDTQLPGRDTCVVKQLYPSSQNPKFLKIARRLFQTEGSTLHNLGHHSQIPSLLAYFEQEEKFYLVQQYIKGKTLAEELDSGHIWSELQVIELLRDVLEILQFIHGKGVIHRDLKPDNLIRRDRDRKLVLVDFGTVKQLLQGQQTNAGQLTVAVGTQGYMPTEQARGKPLPSSDLYALGMIAIQTLTGIIPIDLEENESGEIIWQPQINISRGLTQILTQMTRYHFEDRVSSATEVIEQLNKLPTANITKPQSVTAIHSHTTNIELPRENETTTVVIAQTHAKDSSDRDFSSARGIKAIAPPPINPAKTIKGRSENDRPSKHSNKNTVGKIIAALTIIAIAGSYLYFNQINSENNLPNTPTQPDSSQDESESLPSNPTPRVDQGAGFRDDL